MKYRLMVISWFSCGIASAMATELALKKYSDVLIIYIHNDSESTDNWRFLRECEKRWNHHISCYSSPKYKSHWDVINDLRCINTPWGAPCTRYLKKNVRYMIEDHMHWDAQIMGYDITEQKRAQRFTEQYPATKAEFPLIEAGLSKTDIMALWKKTKIEPPMMYQLGFHNNNCIGCVKGGKGYWALIRKHFPDVFERMVRLEDEIGHTCIRGFRLADLPEDYPTTSPIIPSCSLFCYPDFMK